MLSLKVKTDTVAMIHGVIYMENLDFLKNPTNKHIPLNLITIGNHQHSYLNRIVGQPYHQIFMTTSGKGIFRVPGIGDFELNLGDIIIVLAGTSHEYYSLSKVPWILSYIGFNGGISDSILAQLNFEKIKKIIIPESGQIRETIKPTWAIINHEESDAQWQASQNLYALLLDIKKLSAGVSESQSHLKPINQNKHIQQAAEFIRRHYAEPISVTYLADMVGYTNQHFTRTFKNVFHITPRKYIRKIRLEKARLLLESGDEIRISDIAHKVGMEESYFIKLFKQRFKITPGAYRLKCLNGGYKE